MIGINEALYKACEDNRKLEVEIEEKDKEIERLNKILNKAKEKSIFLQKRYGYILDDLTYLLMQGSDKE